MIADRRTSLRLNGILAAFAIGAVGTLGWIAVHKSRTEEAAPRSPEYKAFASAVQAGHRAVRAGSYVEAERHFQAALGLRSNSVDVRLELAKVYDLWHQDLKAFEQYGLIVQPLLNTNRPIPFIFASTILARYGDLCLEFGQMEKARQAYIRAVLPMQKNTEYSRDQIPLSFIRARAYFQAANKAFPSGTVGSPKADPASQLVAKNFRRAIALDPNYAAAYLRLGELLFDTDKQDAVPLLRKAVAKSARDDLDLRTRAADLLFNVGRKDESQKVLRASLPYWQRKNPIYLNPMLSSLVHVGLLTEARAGVHHRWAARPPQSMGDRCQMARDYADVGENAQARRIVADVEAKATPIEVRNWIVPLKRELDADERRQSQATPRGQ